MVWTALRLTIIDELHRHYTLAMIVVVAAVVVVAVAIGVPNYLMMLVVGVVVVAPSMV